MPNKCITIYLGGIFWNTVGQFWQLPWMIPVTKFRQKENTNGQYYEKALIPVCFITKLAL